MAGFQSSNGFGIFPSGGSGGGGGGSTPNYILPAITQTLTDGANVINLGASYKVCEVHLFTSAGVNIENWDWSLGGGANPCSSITINITGVTYTNAVIYVQIFT